MRSIRARLTLFLLCGLGTLIIAAGLTLEVRITRWLETEFDRALEAKARALVTLTKEQGGEVELDFADEFMPEFQDSIDPQYFELWIDGDRLLERSNSFEADSARRASGLGRDLAVESQPRFTDVELPDIRQGRQVQIDFVPQDVDEGDADPRSPGGLPVTIDPTSTRATLLVAREREELDSQIARLRWSFLAFVALLLVATAALIAVALRLGLGPLDQLTHQVQELKAESLDRRVDLGDPPVELLPVVSQLNELISRLEISFRRERQLTSDIAHELKTPIAELRNLCEVGARWPDDPKTARRFFEDAWTISLQMERIVAHLLALARFDEGAERAVIHEVGVAGIIEQAWIPLRSRATERGLVLVNAVRSDAVLETDSDKLRMILSNLLSNAVEYSRPETSISCDFDVDGRRRSLTVSNFTSELESGDLELMFNRFWRKDEARSGGRNAGLGLAIVRAFSELLKVETTTELTPTGRFTVTLTAID